MKGPGNRLNYTIRRNWECDECHRQETTAGSVVSRLCVCGSRGDPPRRVWMRLVESKPRAKSVAVEMNSTGVQSPAPTSVLPEPTPDKPAAVQEMPTPAEMTDQHAAVPVDRPLTPTSSEGRTVADEAATETVKETDNNQLSTPPRDDSQPT